MWIADEEFLDELPRRQAGIIYESIAPPNAPHYRVMVLSDIHLELPRLGGDIEQRIAKSVGDFLKTARESITAVGTNLNYEFLINCGDILNAGKAAQCVSDKLDTEKPPNRIVDYYKIFYRDFALAALRTVQATRKPGAIQILPISF